MIRAVTGGRPGSAMMGFTRTLSREEIGAVVDFILDTFVETRRENTRYHTVENGWPDHQRYAVTFLRAGRAGPGHRGRSTDAGAAPGQAVVSVRLRCLPRSRPPRSMTVPCGTAGRFRIRGAAMRTGTASLPTRYRPRPCRRGTPSRHGWSTQRPSSGAAKKYSSVTAPSVMRPLMAPGATGIGAFLEPSPRDLTSASVAALPPERLREVIAQGVSGSAMPQPGRRCLMKQSSPLWRPMWRRPSSGATPGRCAEARIDPCPVWHI